MNTSAEEVLSLKYFQNIFKKIGKTFKIESLKNYFEQQLAWWAFRYFDLCSWLNPLWPCTSKFPSQQFAYYSSSVIRRPQSCSDSWATLSWAWTNWCHPRPNPNRPQATCTEAWSYSDWLRRKWWLHRGFSSQWSRAWQAVRPPFSACCYTCSSTGQRRLSGHSEWEASCWAGFGTWTCYSASTCPWTTRERLCLG